VKEIRDNWRELTMIITESYAGMVVNSKQGLNARLNVPAAFLMISPMPTVTNVRLVSRNWRFARSARRCISTSRPPQPPAFVFDIVSAPTLQIEEPWVEVADCASGRMVFCFEARPSWSRRETRLGFSTVTIRSTGSFAWVA
jgi:hypothetical protein